MIATALAPDAVVYPDSDGKRMADNTKQYECIVTIKGNLDVLFRDDPDVFVAGDYLIYAVEGDPKKRRAPDVYVAFGRPKGDRGSYQVWNEGGVFPQVLFEVLSPKNTVEEMRKKKAFYLRHGAEEYYVINPQPKVPTLAVFLRWKGKFVRQPAEGFVSPRLGIRFRIVGTELVITAPDGTRFLSFAEVGTLAKSEKRRADTQQRRADTQQRRADRAEARADSADTKAKAEAAARTKLAAKLRELGIDPDTV